MLEDSFPRSSDPASHLLVKMTGECGDRAKSTQKDLNVALDFELIGRVKNVGRFKQINA